MAVSFLIFSVIAATLGFLIWYALFSLSLRLPKSFQVQFDINPSYFNRILRRRLTGFIVYGLLPYLLLFHWQILGDPSAAGLHISFAWNRDVTRWMLILMPLVILFNWLSARKRNTLVEYPEIRVTIWTPHLLFLSALFWILYLVGMEFMFRGLILQSAYLETGNIWWSILISTGLYAMIHYFKNNRISLLSVPFGAITAYVTLDCGSLLPTIFVHVVGGLLTEWIAIRKHPELKFQVRRYKAAQAS
ncbi:MAG: CPBP family intramembrane glutamic endopeptidase [Saprospiraceae bacterium]|nr:CPBP family intramembrane metalloprotease [Lewinella sp.]